MGMRGTVEERGVRRMHDRALRDRLGRADIWMYTVGQPIIYAFFSTLARICFGPPILCLLCAEETDVPSYLFHGRN